MGKVYLTLKIMPDSPEVDMTALKAKIEPMVAEFQGKVHKSEEEPVGFGLVALKITLMRDEDLGSTDDLEEAIDKLEEVGSVQVVDVRRAIG